MAKFDKGLLLSFSDLPFLSLTNYFKNCLQIIDFKRRRSSALRNGQRKAAKRRNLAKRRPHSKLR